MNLPNPGFVERNVSDVASNAAWSDVDTTMWEGIGFWSGDGSEGFGRIEVRVIGNRLSFPGDEERDKRREDNWYLVSEDVLLSSRKESMVGSELDEGGCSLGKREEKRAFA